MYDDLPELKVFTYKNYPCVIYKQSHGAYCAYVGLTYEKYNPETNDSMKAPYKVHGGITYADYCDELDEAYSKEMNTPLLKYFWLGFDAAHSYDIVPWQTSFDRMINRMVDSLSGSREEGEERTFKDIPYMEKELKSLVDQLEAEAKAKE